MGIGSSSETVELKLVSAEEAFDSAVAALRRAGKVIETDADEGFIRGSTRYGLQRVRLQVHVRQNGDDSVLQVEALADDVWGKGARSGIKRFREELGR